jgi:hypothetical protein
MTSLITRFQEVMGRIKSLEAAKVPGAAALKLATIAAGNLSTSPKGIVAANAALDKVVKQIADLKAKLDQAEAGKPEAGKGGADEAPPQNDGKKLADEARKRLKSLEARGQKAIAANPRNPNAGWLAEVVANSEGRFASLEKYGDEREIESVKKHLDWLEDAVVRFEASAAEEASSGGDKPAKGGGDAAVDGNATVPDAGKLAARERKRLKSLEARGRKAIAADPGNKNDAWLTEVVEDFAGRIDELEAEGTRRQADDVKKQLDWLKENVVRFEASAKSNAAGAEGKKPKAEESPALKKAKAQYRQVMAEIRKLATAKHPGAEALAKAAAAAGNLATSPKGIEDATKALDAVMVDVSKAKAEVAKAKAEAVKGRADAAKAKRARKPRPPRRRRKPTTAQGRRRRGRGRRRRRRRREGRGREDLRHHGRRQEARGRRPRRGDEGAQAGGGQAACAARGRLGLPRRPDEPAERGAVPGLADLGRRRDQELRQGPGRGQDPRPEHLGPGA